jgi:predicted deacetylase
MPDFSLKVRADNNRTILAEKPVTASPAIPAGTEPSHRPLGARCLLRFDDMCPTMDRAIWDPVEALLMELGIRPLLAVVPDNRDPYLDRGPRDPRFWDRVREWQARGWTIGLHGYQHSYRTLEKGLVGLLPFSEFAGVPKEKQEDNLIRAVEIFDREKVKPEVWVAPAHSFDETTVSILRRLGINMISDGFHCYPHRDHTGMIWVPQQFGNFRKLPFGLSTICIHLEDYPHSDLAIFGSQLRKFQKLFIGFDEVTSHYPCDGQSLLDNAFARGFLRLKRFKADRG